MRDPFEAPAGEPAVDLVALVLLGLLGLLAACEVARFAVWIWSTR